MKQSHHYLASALSGAVLATLIATIGAPSAVAQETQKLAGKRVGVHRRLIGDQRGSV